MNGSSGTDGVNDKRILRSGDERNEVERARETDARLWNKVNYLVVRRVIKKITQKTTQKYPPMSGGVLGGLKRAHINYLI